MTLFCIPLGGQDLTVLSRGVCLVPLSKNILALSFTDLGNSMLPGQCQ